MDSRKISVLFLLVFSIISCNNSKIKVEEKRPLSNNYDFPLLFPNEHDEIYKKDIMAMEDSFKSLKLNHSELLYGLCGWHRIFLRDNYCGGDANTNDFDDDDPSHLIYARKLNNPNFLWCLIEYSFTTSDTSNFDNLFLSHQYVKIFHEDEIFNHSYGSIHLENDKEFSIDTFVDYYYFLEEKLLGNSCNEIISYEGGSKIKSKEKNYGMKHFENGMYISFQKNDNNECVYQADFSVEPVLPDHYYEVGYKYPSRGFRELELLGARDFNSKKDWAIHYKCEFYSPKN